MQFYKNGFRGGNPDIQQAAPNRRNRGVNEPLPEKVDVLISGTGPAGLCLAAQLSQFPEISTMIVERMASNADIDNRLKSMLDTIVTAGVIADDSLVTAIAVSWLPKANGMAHVRLYPVQQLELSFHPSPSGACGGFFVAPSTQEDCQDGFPL